MKSLCYSFSLLCQFCNEEKHEVLHYTTLRGKFPDFSLKLSYEFETARDILLLLILSALAFHLTVPRARVHKIEQEKIDWKSFLNYLMIQIENVRKIQSYFSFLSKYSPIASDLWSFQEKLEASRIKFNFYLLTNELFLTRWRLTTLAAQCWWQL